MNKTPIVLLALLVSCTKNPEVLTSKATVSKPEICSFGLTAFNTTLRAPIDAVASVARKKNTATPINSTPAATLLLVFDGQNVSNTLWNVERGDIQCQPANVTEGERENILERVSEDFRPFNVVVTDNRDLFNRTNPRKRVQIVITESWQWFGMAGGASVTGSINNGDDMPAFVFSSLLNYDEKMIAEAVSHEAGHTLGLRHQSQFNNCVFQSEYNDGKGEGVTSWAPIMGNSYYRNVTTWYNGVTPYSCTSTQDEVKMIADVFGFKTDDYGNTVNNAQKIDGDREGTINNSSDVDVFELKVLSPTKVTAVPYAVNTSNYGGANMHLQLKVYDFKGTLIQTVVNPNSLCANTTLDKGKYYVSVETVDDQYASRYGMMGNYSLKLN